MKQLKFISIVALLLFMFSFAECFKTTPPPADNPYGLPNATQTGAGVFACRINGVNFVAKAGPYNQSGGQKNDSLIVRGSGLLKYNIFILGLGIYGNFITNYNYDLTDTIHSFAYYSGTACPYESLNAIKVPSGTILFTKIDMSTTYKIASGIFNMKVFDGCDTLNITDGRFDIGFN